MMDKSSIIWAILQPSIIWVAFLVFFIIYFRRNIQTFFNALSGFCDRTSTIQYGEFKLGTNSHIPLGEQGISDIKYVEMLKAFQSPIVNSEEKTIRSQLSENKWSDKQAKEVLISQLAYKNFLTLLLFIDKLIFNEQIKLLLYLNNQGKACHESVLEQFYLEWKSINQRIKAVISTNNVNETDYTYEQFLMFLCQNGLISQNIHDYSITVLGKEYLSFIVRIGRQLPFLFDSANKPT